MTFAVQDEEAEPHHGWGAVCAGGVGRGWLAGFGGGKYAGPGFFERVPLQYNFKQSVAGFAEEEAEIFRHVGYRCFEAAVGRGDPGIEVDGLRRELSPGAEIAGGDVVLEKIRCAIEVALSHAERLEDVLIDVDLEVVPGESLDDLAEEDIAEV